MASTALAVALRTVVRSMVAGRHTSGIHTEWEAHANSAHLQGPRLALHAERRPRRRLHAVDLAAEDPPSPASPCRSLLSSCVLLPLRGRLRRALPCPVTTTATLTLACCARSGCTAPHRLIQTLLNPPPPPTVDLSTPPPHPSPLLLCSSGVKHAGT